MSRNLIKCVLLSILFFWSNGSINSQIETQGIPVVFLIGEYEKEYETIVASQDLLLLNVCDDSMDKAYSLWTGMLKEMEMLSKDMGVDLNGVKIWLNVFWNEEGKIDHLVYYPKPHSKNLDFNILTAFFVEFSNLHESGIESEGSFSHYGSASFPTFSSNLNAAEK